VTDASARPSAAPCGIAVMAKASAPGRTKTRLAPPLTHEEAAAFNTAFLRDVAARLVAVEGVAGAMAYGPPGPEAEAFFAATMPPGIDLIECWHGDFGACLVAAVEGLLARGRAAAVVLNSDSPTLPAALLSETARALAAPGDRAVLGPSTDGGYYLLGLKRAHRRLFEDVAWSTDQVAAQTLARAAEIGLPVHVLPPWYDVDDAASLRTLHGELFEGRPFDPARPSGAAPHSRALFERLLAGTDLAGRIGLDARVDGAGRVGPAAREATA
jgi:uncharacterized protein